jgi:hypothetical protein
MKKVIITISAVVAILVSANFNLKAQEKVVNDLKFSNQEFFENSDFIVEGSLIQARSYDKNGIKAYYYGIFNPEDIFSEYVFQVDWVYKSVDNLVKAGDTIVIIVERGWIGKRRIDANGDTLYYGYNGLMEDSYDGRFIENNWNLKHLDLMREKSILFLNKTNLPVNPHYKSRYLHSEFLRDREFARFVFNDVYENDTLEFCIQSRTVGQTITGLNNLSFDKETALNDYLRQYKNLSVPYEGQKDSVKKALEEERILKELSRPPKYKSMEEYDSIKRIKWESIEPDRFKKK